MLNSHCFSVCSFVVAFHLECAINQSSVGNSVSTRCGSRGGLGPFRFALFAQRCLPTAIADRHNDHLFQCASKPIPQSLPSSSKVAT